MTSTGRRVLSRITPARVKAWAGVDTAMVALDAPITRAMAGSFAKEGRERAPLTWSGYRDDATRANGSREAVESVQCHLDALAHDGLHRVGGHRSATSSTVRSALPGRFKT